MIAVTNFPPKQIADFISEVLILGVVIGNGDAVVLLQTERDVPPGSRILCRQIKNKPAYNVTIILPLRLWPYLHGRKL